MDTTLQEAMGKDQTSMQIEAYMRAHITCEYCGNNEYRVFVIVDGRVEQILSATRGTVARVRNRAREKWAKFAREVEAAEIPKAWDMHPKSSSCP